MYDASIRGLLGWDAAAKEPSAARFGDGKSAAYTVTVISLTN